MSILNNSLLLGADAGGGAGGYQISRSLRFNSSDSAYLSRTPNRKTWTWSGWVKRSSLGVEQRFFSASTASTNSSYFEFTSGDQLSILNYVSSSVKTQRVTTQVFRDTSAWYHIVVASNSSTSFNVYVNGSEVTAFASTAGPDASDWFFNGANLHTIGTTSYSLANYFSGYLADVHFIDGQALTPSSFTEVSATTGQLIPKQYTGSFGTNGFWLKFSDNSAATATTLGKDYSGNSNNWTPNNLSVTAGAGNDSLVDTPTSYGTDTGAGGQVRGNYCTWNPLDKDSTLTLANGNLDSGYTGSGSWALARGTIGVSSGKWYWEITAGTASHFLGIANGAHATNIYVGGSSLGYGYWGTNGQKAANAGAGQSYGATYTTGDVIGVAFDADNWTLTFYKNGVSQGTAFTSITSSTYFPAISTSASSTATVNFGQRPFAYAAPSGFKALCDTNLPAPTIARPSTVMDVKLYTGNGGTQTISGMGFSPDLVWIKCRSTGGTAHVLQDVVRGPTSYLVPNSTAAENTNTANDWFRAFTSDGFTVAASTTGGTPTSEWNASSSTYVAWTWDAGSSTVTNTQGSITSSVRANASAGFSIVSWTPQASAGTVGHGLNVAPELIITKDRAAANGWFTYHKSLGIQNYLVLNLTNAVTSNATVFSTAPTSTVFNQGSGFTSTNTYGNQICYCFAPVAGYSAFGSYTGNGSADGPFVFTGFRPRWLLIKNATGGTVTDAWLIYDAVRDTYNVASKYLYADSSNAEATYGIPDFCSNGFKLRQSSGESNASAATYIYAAFAEFPFQYARAR